MLSAFIFVLRYLLVNKVPDMSDEIKYQNLAILANLQEVAVRVMHDVSGNEIMAQSHDEMTQDIAACIGDEVNKGVV